jgi:hypothetical protein
MIYTQRMGLDGIDTLTAIAATVYLVLYLRLLLGF